MLINAQMTIRAHASEIKPGVVHTCAGLGMVVPVRSAAAVRRLLIDSFSALGSRERGRPQRILSFLGLCRPVHSRQNDRVYKGCTACKVSFYLIRLV